MKMSSFSLLSLFFSLFILSLASSHHNFHNLTGSRLGDTNPAIVDLKKYLHHFGYLEKSQQYYTDCFDDELHVALGRYQHYFNLEVTGVIDPPTTQLLTTPRCGVPDIIVTPGGGKLHYSFFPNRPKWPTSRRNLRYSIDNTYRGIGNYTVSRIMASAFARWENVSDFNFHGTQTFSNPDITIGFYKGDHGDGYPFDGRLGVLAHAFAPEDGRFHLDSDEVWTTNVRTATSPYAVDLESVSVHEIGHLLGLDHSNDTNAIMYPSISPRMRKVNLGRDDIQGLKVLYGYPPLDIATY